MSFKKWSLLFGCGLFAAAIGGIFWTPSGMLAFMISLMLMSASPVRLPCPLWMPARTTAHCLLRSTRKLPSLCRHTSGHMFAPWSQLWMPLNLLLLLIIHHLWVLANLISRMWADLFLIHFNFVQFTVHNQWAKRSLPEHVPRGALAEEQSFQPTTEISRLWTGPVLQSYGCSA